MDQLIERLSQKIRGFRPTKPVDLQGWMDMNVKRVFEKLPDAKLMIEVGTWKGLSAVTFASELKKRNGKLICIDTWLGSSEHFIENLMVPEHDFGYPKLYHTFLSNVYHVNLQDTIVPLPVSSEQASDILQHFGFENNVDAIYIDAGHQYNQVKKDIYDYWKFVKPGGILFGDDYSENWLGVIKAVNEFAEENKLRLEVHGPVWYVQKPSM